MTDRRSTAGGQRRLLEVTDKSTIATNVVSLTFRDVDGGRLPEWTPGSHIDLHLPNGATRQYSLCGNRWKPGEYRIAVLKEGHGRGGSDFIHQHVNVGDRLAIGGPRNNFAILPAQHYIFIAGGIGITPIIPMIDHVRRLGARWELLYGGRTRESMAFLNTLQGDNITIFAKNEHGRMCLRRELEKRSQDSTRVYCCGPAEMVSDAAAAVRSVGRARFHSEHFSAKSPPNRLNDREFDIHLARSGKTLLVTAGSSILDVARGAGVVVLSSCETGTCGTCETGVLAGVPDHRDSIHDDPDAVSDIMYICVSRSQSPHLTLDL
ncbi:MAG: hypothetical protein BGO26_00900 [Actinobacteria bacterium 69-20]|jgi:ferredoxin-NADP reductase|nr:oxidoreductase [Actinomycetota bacterium]OJV28565.1 MAG: hypothetical protein BGO26_00900 [Actinobacteria bacterium 69-20]